ncbi:zeatin O-glucosyltransferase [Jatropha curcas]|uniref:zeatin O-glucosyltransferase n=1 Tax=Jatropha curcas TaxID=180498 RepID=UPI0018960BF4|nr:zeatin O-glucosyltransferase [Jatropha curcas]
MANHQSQGQQAHALYGFKQTKVIVVMVPLPAQGHLNQLLQLSRLILSYDIPVHFVGTTTHNRQAKLRVHGWDPQAAAAATSSIHFHDFEIPTFSCPSANPNAKNKFPSHLLPAFYASVSLREPVSFLLRSLSCQARKIIVIHDSLMGSVVQEIQFISNAESYTFHSVSAFTLCLFLSEKMGRNIKLNDAVPKQLPPFEGCFTNEFLDFVASEYQYHKFNSGCIYNTSRLIEGIYMDLIENQEKESVEKNIKKHWALGPFNPLTIPDKKGLNEKHFCLKWLDKQERNSVIFVSFGTTTALSNEQVKQLAIGLKKSNQKFIWVLRDADKGDVFNKDSEKKAELPKGYEDSIQGMGIVVREWVPQLEILAHQAIGGFMSHCGWNSCMESITMGVPIAAWPMHSDQPRNAVLITDLLKIGIVIKDWCRRDEIVTAKMVETCVKRLMASDEGEGVRKRAAELGESLHRSMGRGGVSRLEIDSFVAYISR